MEAVISVYSNSSRKWKRMMKTKAYRGIVIKVTPEYIVLMCERGTFKNVPRTSSEMPKIGESYLYKKREWSSFSGIHYLSMVSVLFLFIIGYVVFSSSQVEEAYVLAIDINPSIEIYADEDLSVIRIKGLNEEGQEIIDAIDPVKRNINQLMTEIVNQSVQQNYLKQTEKGMVSISIVPLKEKVETMDIDIHKIVKTSLQLHSVDAEVLVKLVKKQDLEKAKELNLSINKFQLYEELKAEGIYLPVELFHEQSVLQIKKIEATYLKEKITKEEILLENENNQTHNNNSNQKEPPKKVIENKEEKENRINQGNNNISDNQKKNENPKWDRKEEEEAQDKIEEEEVEEEEKEAIEELEDEEKEKEAIGERKEEE
jgi:hypothetical protein